MARLTRAQQSQAKASHPRNTANLKTEKKRGKRRARAEPACKSGRKPNFEGFAVAFLVLCAVIENPPSSFPNDWLMTIENDVAARFPGHIFPYASASKRKRFVAAILAAMAALDAGLPAKGGAKAVAEASREGGAAALRAALAAVVSGRAPGGTEELAKAVACLLKLGLLPPFLAAAAAEAAGGGAVAAAPAAPAGPACTVKAEAKFIARGARAARRVRRVRRVRRGAVAAAAGEAAPMVKDAPPAAAPPPPPAGGGVMYVLVRVDADTGAPLRLATAAEVDDVAASLAAAAPALDDGLVLPGGAAAWQEPASAPRPSAHTADAELDRKAEEELRRYLSN